MRVWCYIMELKKMKFTDLFAGIGGFRYALESFRCKCFFSSEWDKYCQESYNLNFGEIPYGLDKGNLFIYFY